MNKDILKFELQIVPANFKPYKGEVRHYTATFCALTKPSIDFDKTGKKLTRYVISTTRKYFNSNTIIVHESVVTTAPNKNEIFGELHIVIEKKL